MARKRNTQLDKPAPETVTSVSSLKREKTTPTSKHTNNGGKGLTTSKKLGGLLLPYPTDRQLTPKEAKFIREILKDPDVTLAQAARNAGYSIDTAGQIGAQVLRRPHVMSELRDQFQALVHKERLSVERLLSHIIQLAEVDKRSLFNADGTLKDIKDLSRYEASLIRSFTVEELWEKDYKGKRLNKIGEIKRVQLTDHMEPIKLLTKYLQNFLPPEPQPTHINQYNTNISIDFKVLKDDELFQLRQLIEVAEQRTREGVLEGEIITQ